jgi:hypothetical protein
MPKNSQIAVLGVQKSQKNASFLQLSYEPTKQSVDEMSRLHA